MADTGQSKPSLSPYTSESKRSFSWSSVFSYQSIGIAFLRVWSMLAFTGGALFILQEHPADYASFVSTLSLLVLVVILLSLPFFLSILKRAPKKFVGVFAVGCLVGGTLTLSFGEYSGDIRGVLMWLGIVLTGLGSAIMNILWGISFSKLSAEQVFGASSATILFTALVYIAIQGFPLPLLAISSLVCPVLSLIFLTRTPVNLDDAAYYRLPEEPKKYRPLFITILAFGVIVGVMRELTITHPLIEVDYGTIRMLAAVFVFLVLFILAFVHTSLTPGKVYRYGVFVVALGLALALFVNSFQNTVFFALASFVVLCGYHLFHIVVWTEAAHLSIRRRLSPLFTFSWGWGFLYLGLLLGKLLSRAYGIYFPSEEWMFRIPLIAVLLIFILAIYHYGLSKTFMPGEEEPRANGRYKNRCNQVAEHYQLTARQSEILCLLAKGKSVKMIQEELTLSAGTVNTHISNIYRKLCVNCRDELMDLVEKWE